VRASEAAALRSGHAAARALRRKDGAPVTADEESFTTARHLAARGVRHQRHREHQTDDQRI
jgi:hypothetical protein